MNQDSEDFVDDMNFRDAIVYYITSLNTLLHYEGTHRFVIGDAVRVAAAVCVKCIKAEFAHYMEKHGDEVDKMMGYQVPRPDGEHPQG